MSRQNLIRENGRGADRDAMGRLIDVAVDDLLVGDREIEEKQALSTLQEILFGSDRDQIQVLAENVTDLRRRIEDKDALAAAVAPVLGEAIRQQIQDSREEIIDALYPVIGQIVVRAVSEAIRDLARSIDERLHAVTDSERIWQRLRSILTGIPLSSLILRESLPVLVQEIYVIHRESGLLLWYATNGREQTTDSDLISAMLTAIREFAEQVLGGNGENLRQLQFGNRELVLEFGRHVYVGLLLEGVAPTQFRWNLHRHIYAFEKNQQHHLRHYDGDASVIQEAASRAFEPFLSTGPAASWLHGSDS